MRLVPFLFVGFVSISLLFGSDVDDAALLLKETKTRRKATVELKRLAKSDNQQTSLAAIRALYQEYSQDKPDWLTALLEPYGKPTSENLTYPRVEFFALNCQLLMLNNKERTAKNVLSKAKDATTGLPKVVAYEATGDCLRMKGSPKSALKSYKDALGIGAKHFKREKISVSGERADAKPFSKEWGNVKRRISGKIKGMEKELRIDELGLDYVLYEEARKLHAKGKTNEAHAKYSLIISKFGDKNIYSVASDFFRRFCNIPEADTKRATSLKGFLRKDKYGLYRGEALYEVARLELLQQSDPRKALKQFELALKWCNDVKNPTFRPSMSVPEKSRAVSRPPKVFGTVKSDAVVMRAEIPPGMLVNRLTCDWYLPELEKKVRIGAAACHMLLEKWDDAGRTLMPVISLDPAIAQIHRKGITNAYFRLMLACKNRYLIFRKEELAKVPRNYRCQMVFADLDYLLGDLDAAIAGYQGILAKAKEEKNRDVEAVSLVALAGVYTMVGNLDTAKANLRRVCSYYGTAPVRGKAELYLGNLVCRDTISPAMAQASVNHYKNALKYSRDKAVIDAARWAISTRLAYLGDLDQARSYAEKLDGEMNAFAVQKISMYEQQNRNKDR